MSPEESISFGTDGWRARMDESFTVQNVARVAQAIANFLRKRDKIHRGVAIGHDTRRNSRIFAEEVVCVLAGNGIKCLLASEDVPTPVLTFVILKWDLDGAVMLTASHNPAAYNGLKFIPEYASPAMPDITDVITEEIVKIKDDKAVSKISIEEAKEMGLCSEFNPKDEYIKHILDRLDHSLLRKKRFKVAFDPLYGTARTYLPVLLKHFGHEVFSIHDSLDPDFGGKGPNPSKENLRELEQLVVDSKADIGFACDGDADRSGVVTDKGEFILAQDTFCLLLKYLIMKKETGLVVKTLDTTRIVDKIADSHGLPLEEVPIGSKYIGKVMREENCLLGGEQSGGLMFRNHIAEKDGIFTNLKILEALAYFDKPLSEILQEIIEEFGKSFFDQSGISCTDELKPKVMSEIARVLPKDVNGEKIVRTVDVDGFKLILEDKSWVLIRPSGTEPLIRVSAESPSEQKTKSLISFGKALIERLKQ